MSFDISQDFGDVEPLFDRCASAQRQTHTDCEAYFDDYIRQATGLHASLFFTVPV